jgi:hypothetical protein
MYQKIGDGNVFLSVCILVRHVHFLRHFANIYYIITT